MSSGHDTAAPGGPSIPPLRRPGLVAAFLVAYVALDWVSYLYPVSPLAITVWNPPPGLSLSLLLLAGLECAPALFVAALVADVVVRGAPGPVWFVVVSTAAIAAGYTLVGALLVRVAHIDPTLRRARDVILLLVFAVAGAGVIAVVSIALNVAAGLVSPQDFTRYAVRFWIGDAIGVAVTTPLILVHAAWRAAHDPPADPRAREGLLQLASLVGALVLALWWAHPAEAALFYVLFVPVVWIAVRRGLRGTTAALVLVQIVLIGVLWARGNPLETVLQFQFLMLALASTALILAATVDEQARIGARLAEREEELRTVLEAAPDGILSIDAQGCIREANPAAGAILGVVPAGLRGRPLAPMLASTAGALVGEGVGERWVLREDGSRTSVEYSMAEASRAGLRIAVLRDVSQRRASEERLREQQEELSRALRLAAAGEMTSALAHELHQPLSAMASYAKACIILAGSGDQARLEDSLRRMGVEIGRASDVVRRLREFFRSGAARLERIGVADLVRDALESTRARLARHHVALVTRLAEPAPFVLGDRVQLTVVIHNLVGNSIDALTRSDGTRRVISLSVERRGNEVVIVVEDSGPGVPPEEMASLFTPFVTSKADGMGLGLSICRYIAEAHGGRLWAEPLPAGTAFHVALPVDEARGTSHEPA